MATLYFCWLMKGKSLPSGSLPLYFSIRGNLYKKVKDPNLVGALSGHKDGSRAFARYREIDDDLKKELISILD